MFYYSSDDTTELHTFTHLLDTTTSSCPIDITYTEQVSCSATAPEQTYSSQYTVPSNDYSTIRAAVNAIPSSRSGTLVVNTGTYQDTQDAIVLGDKHAFVTSSSITEKVTYKPMPYAGKNA